MTTINKTRLDIRQVAARIGAEVTGLDLGRQLDTATVSAIRSALNERSYSIKGDASHYTAIVEAAQAA